MKRWPHLNGAPKAKPSPTRMGVSKGPRIPCLPVRVVILRYAAFFHAPLHHQVRIQRRALTLGAPRLSLQQVLLRLAVAVEVVAGRPRRALRKGLLRQGDCCCCCWTPHHRCHLHQGWCRHRYRARAAVATAAQGHHRLLLSRHRCGGLATRTLTAQQESTTAPAQPWSLDR